MKYYKYEGLRWTTLYAVSKDPVKVNNIQITHKGPRNCGEIDAVLSAIIIPQDSEFDLVSVDTIEQYPEVAQEDWQRFAALAKAYMTKVGEA